ncbi:MAG TPA: PDZ domain-containing protein [Rhizobacter sp.]|nr:PDZ domain-containing protein [Rhizobacter sp.]
MFGVTVAITADGWLNPTVRTAKVTQVQPGLPAHRAGIAAGDEVLELDGKRIPGATAGDLAPLAKGKRVGERLAVMLQRPNGTAYTAVLVAEPPPR